MVSNQAAAVDRSGPEGGERLSRRPRFARPDADELDELISQDLGRPHRQYKKLNVLIRGDKLATHGHMTEVYNACQRAGITELAISVKLDTATR